MLKRKATRRLAGIGLAVALGLLAGAAPAKSAPQARGCGQEESSTGGCQFTFQDWYCDGGVGECVTRDCATGEQLCNGKPCQQGPTKPSDR